MTSSPALVGDLAVAWTVSQIEHLHAGLAPRWVLPRHLAGHVVGADVRADAVFTLTHLANAGVDEVTGERIDQVITTLLAATDGEATHTFASYRVAETLLRAGPFDGNRLLAGLSDHQRDQVARACDTSTWVELLDAAALPRNYAAVLARAELACDALGIGSDPDRLADLVERTRSLLAENPDGYLDDANDGSGRYDIYSVDLWLFCEPLADRFGALWEHGIESAIDLVDRVGCHDASAVPWGRSTGVLAVALSLEIAAVAIARGHDRARWLRRAGDALAALDGWFDSGLCSAHQHRDQDAYRGPARRLQLTFDVLGKVAWSAGVLRAAGNAPVRSVARHEAYPERDEIIRFERGRHAAAWVVRSPGQSFVMPFVGPARSHYLPALHDPGRFEVPVDADLPCWTPLISVGPWRHTFGGLPSALAGVAGAGVVSAEWSEAVATAPVFGGEPVASLDARRDLRLTLDGRTIVIDDHLTFVDPPDAISVCIPETAGQPLAVTVESSTGHTTSTVSVDGISEWRSSWSSLHAVHQIELAPARQVRWRMRVTPALRVSSTAHHHPYHRNLYAPLGARVLDRPSAVGAMADASVRLADVDLFHLHWPEWLCFDDLAAHEATADELHAQSTPIVWTAHNLTPHQRNDAVYDPIYSLWAQRADAVIHHSHWGRERMLERYRFAPETRHVVIHHGHWGEQWAPLRVDRDEAEDRLGLRPGRVRIGLVGAPRVDKWVDRFLEAVTRSRRDDIEVVCWSLAWGATAPDDDRIAVATRYREVAPATYVERLSTLDVLAMPFDPDGDMLCTGTAFDAIGFGVPVLGTRWGFLEEALGDGLIPMGTSAQEMAAALDALDAGAIDAARKAVSARRSATEWSLAAEATYELFDEVVLDPRVTRSRRAL